MKVCNKCKIEKPLTEFSKAKNYKDGIRSICNECKREEGREYYHRKKHSNPYDYKKDKNNKLKKAYGITYDEYLILLEGQEGCCAICGTSDMGKRKAFSVDHNHDTGKIRGLLCNYCNTGIGGLQDDVNLLKKSIEYLKNPPNKDYINTSK